MGKPFGNGMPLAAVVTTQEVAKSFDNGLEYFNTFGGNPVVCAAGLAVLDVIHDEQLQVNAANVGAYLKEQLQSLSEKQHLIGDIRGQGLFVGIEFVRDRVSLEPAMSETSELCARMKEEHHILMSIDGPHDNVLVIKPPMCFSKANVDALIKALDQTLSNLRGTNQEGQAWDRTPT